MGFDSTRGIVMMFGGRNFGIGIGDTWAFSYSYLSLVAPDRCVANVDSDGDGLIGCGSENASIDPDCVGRCFPSCAAGMCNVSEPHCGDGFCNSALEDYWLCPVDCSML